MTSAAVVEGLNEVEDGELCLGVGRPPVVVNELALERRTEALAEGVVVAVADGPPGRNDAGFSTPFTERPGAVVDVSVISIP